MSESQDNKRALETVIEQQAMRREPNLTPNSLYADCMAGQDDPWGQVLIDGITIASMEDTRRRFEQGVNKLKRELVNCLHDHANYYENLNDLEIKIDHGIRLCMSPRLFCSLPEEALQRLPGIAIIKIRGPLRSFVNSPNLAAVKHLDVSQALPDLCKYHTIPELLNSPYIHSLKTLNVGYLNWQEADSARQIANAPQLNHLEALECDAGTDVLLELFRGTGLQNLRSLKVEPDKIQPDKELSYSTQRFIGALTEARLRGDAVLPKLEYFNGYTMEELGIPPVAQVGAIQVQENALQTGTHRS